MGARMDKTNYRTGKKGCYLPRCSTCGYTQKYLQDKSRYKLLCSIFPKQTAIYMRELAVESYSKTEVPNYFTENVDYITIVTIYNMLIKHLDHKHDGYVFLAGDFATFIEGLTHTFRQIDFFVFASFKRSALLTCIPSIFKDAAGFLRKEGFDSEVKNVKVLSPLTNFFRINIELSCTEKKPKLRYSAPGSPILHGEIKKNIEVFKFCLHISNGRNQYLEQIYLYPFEFRKDGEQSWLKHNDLTNESRDNIAWLTRAKQLVHEFLGTMFDSVLHPDGERIYRFNWPDLIKENDYPEWSSEDIEKSNTKILNKIPRFPVKSLFRLAWEHIPTKYDGEFWPAPKKLGETPGKTCRGGEKTLGDALQN